jgi:hypothetical protein
MQVNDLVRVKFPVKEEGTEGIIKEISSDGTCLVLITKGDGKWVTPGRVVGYLPEWLNLINRVNKDEI